MRNLTTAVFLTFIFCAVSAGGKDLAKGTNQKPSSESASSSMMSDTKKMFGKVKSFFGFGERGKAERAANQKKSSSARKVSGKPRQLKHTRSFRNTLWEDKLKEWERRQSAVPQSLPRASTFKSHRHSSSRSYRSSHRSFRSSHHRNTRHVRRGRSHVRRRSRR